MDAVAHWHGRNEGSISIDPQHQLACNNSSIMGSARFLALAWCGLLLALPRRARGLDMYPDIEPTKVRLGSSFKWGEGNAPRWTGVFMASNDRVPILEAALDAVRAFPRERRALVTVIGGMKYLDILGQLEFSEVHFFDMNINELTKLRIVHADIRAKDYDAWIAGGGAAPVGVPPFLHGNG